MKQVLTVGDLRRRLIEAGQERTDEAAGNTDVWPRPDTIATVALNLDPTLRTLYRERYYVCLLESEQNPVPVLQHDDEFDLSGPFRSAAANGATNPFLIGPFRWLVHRLGRFPKVLLWPGSGGDRSGRFAQPGLLNELPGLA